MKKLFTLLILLSAFFAMPRSAQAAVEWEVSDGTQWRINPNNPGDPNDSILIPVGTKFVRIMCAYYGGKPYIYSDCGRIVLSSSWLIGTRYDDYNVRHLLLEPYNMNYVLYDINRGDFKIYESMLAKSPANFPDMALRVRLAERNFGYNWLRISYDNNSYGGIVNGSMDLAKRAYAYKIIITEEEALNVKSLNFDPEKLGLREGLGGVQSIKGLEIFQNLEELYLRNNRYLGRYYSGGYAFISNYTKSQAIMPEFCVFTKLKVLDLSNVNVYLDYNYNYPSGIYRKSSNGGLSVFHPLSNSNFLEFTFTDFPKSLEYLYMRKSALGPRLILDNYPNLKKVDVSECYYHLRNLCVINCPSLDTLLVSNDSILESLKCYGCNLTELNLTGCTNLYNLNCSDNLLETLTFDSSHPKLSYVECQNNNLTSLNLSNIKPEEKMYPTIGTKRIWKYDVINSDSTGGTRYTYVDMSTNVSGDTVYNWSYRTFTTTPQYDYGEMVSPDIEIFEYYDEEGDYHYTNAWYTSRRINITNPSIPVQYAPFAVNGGGLIYLDCSNNNISNLQLPNKPQYLRKLYCYNNKLTELDLTDCTSLQRLRMSHNKIPQIDVSNCKELIDIYAKNRIGEPGFAGWNHGLTSLDCSGLTKLTEVRLSRNKMTSLDMSGCSSLQTLTCDNQGGSDARTLEVLNLTGCSNLNTLDCQNNALTSLDLSTCTSLAAGGVKAYVQRSEKDVKVIDRDKVCIELVNGVTPTIADNGTISDTHMDNYFGTWTGSGFDKERNKVIKRDGKTYLVIYDISDDARGGKQREYDVDLYGNKLKYQYAIGSNSWDETLGGSLANNKKADNVTVTIYPYVMYINPISKDIHSEEVTQQGKEPFYSGTIYLDYDAIVPAGATAYIAKRIKINQDLIYSTAGGGHQKVTADQLQLVPLVAGEGASEVVIPAYTPVYVKSDTEFGLFSFDRNNHGGIEQALGYAQDGSHLTKDNILRGVLTDSAITKYSVLSLGRGRPKGSDDNGYTTESRIGFWPFSGTTIPAHRVFIPISELENAGGSSSSPGLLFSFTDDIDENNTTDIRTAVISKDNGWYTIGGIRLSGRPTEKGIYIHNGRKEVIR